VGAGHETSAARRGVVAVTVLATFVAFLDATIVNVAFPAIRSSFAGADLATLSWVINGYNIVFAGLLLPMGRLGDVIGQRRVFFAGMSLFALGSAGCGVSPTVGALIVSRIVQAVGAGMLMPSALALLLPVFPAGERARGVALGAAAAGVAAAVGPALGGLLVSASTWRIIFAVNLPLAALVWVLGRRVLPTTPRGEGSALPDPLGAAVIALAFGLIAVGLVQGSDWGWSSGRVVAAFVFGVALLPLAVWRSAVHPRAVLPLPLFRSRDVAVGNLATAVFAAGFFAKILCDVLFLTSVWGYSVVRAGLALSPSPLITAVVAASAGRAASRYGHRVVVVVGSLLYAAGTAWYALALPAHPAYVTRFLPATLLTGVGIACALPMLTSAAVSGLRTADLGVGSGANATARQLGGVLGIAILVAILHGAGHGSSLGAFHAGWAFIAVASACTAGLGLLLGPHAAAHIEPAGDAVVGQPLRSGAAGS
jgi:EmrB/QacA subfamily drug resistance transporter